MEWLSFLGFLLIVLFLFLAPVIEFRPNRKVRKSLLTAGIFFLLSFGFSSVSNLIKHEDKEGLLVLSIVLIFVALLMVLISAVRVSSGSSDEGEQSEQ